MSLDAKHSRKYVSTEGTNSAQVSHRVSQEESPVEYQIVSILQKSQYDEQGCPSSPSADKVIKNANPYKNDGTDTTPVHSFGAKNVDGSSSVIFKSHSKNGTYSKQISQSSFKNASHKRKDHQIMQINHFQANRMDLSSSKNPQKSSEDKFCGEYQTPCIGEELISYGNNPSSFLSEQTKKQDPVEINSEELVSKIAMRNPVKKHTFQGSNGEERDQNTENSHHVSDFNQIVSFDKKFDHQKVCFKNHFLDNKENFSHFEQENYQSKSSQNEQEILANLCNINMNDLASIVKLKNRDLPSMHSQPIEFHPSEDYVSDDQSSPERKSYLDQTKHPSTVYEVDEEYLPRQSDQDFNKLKRKDKFCINSQQALAAVKPFDLGVDSGDSMYMLNSSITQSEKNLLFTTRDDRKIPPPPTPPIPGLGMMSIPAPPMSIPAPPLPGMTFQVFPKQAPIVSQKFQTVGVKFTYGKSSSVFDLAENEMQKDKIEKQLEKYFPRSKAAPTQKRTISPISGAQRKNKVEIRFDGLLDQKRVVAIQSSMMKFKFLQNWVNLQKFIDKIVQGLGYDLEEPDLHQFVLIIPTESEIQKFMDRLKECGISSLDEYHCIVQTLLKPPLPKDFTYQMRKIEKAEEFILFIIKNEQVIEKAKILMKLKQLERSFANQQSQVFEWEKLEGMLTGARDATSDYRGLDQSILAQVLNLALQISKTMNPKTQQSKPSGLDIKRSIMVFFDKKSITVEAKQQIYDSSGMPQKSDVVLYDLLLKQLITQLVQESNAQISENPNDMKLHIAQQLQNIFDKDDLELLKACQKMDFVDILKAVKLVVKDCEEIIQKSDQYENDPYPDFKEMLKVFRNVYEKEVRKQVSQLRENIQGIDKRIKEYFCMVNEEDTLQDLIDVLLKLNQKHQTRVQKYIKKRQTKMHQKAIKQSLDKKLQLGRVKSQRSSPKMSPNTSLISIPSQTGGAKSRSRNYSKNHNYTNDDQGTSQTRMKPTIPTSKTTQNIQRSASQNSGKSFFTSQPQTENKQPNPMSRLKRVSPPSQRTNFQKPGVTCGFQKAQQSIQQNHHSRQKSGQSGLQVQQQSVNYKVFR